MCLSRAKCFHKLCGSTCTPALGSIWRMPPSLPLLQSFNTRPPSALRISWLGGATVFRFWLWNLRMNLFPSPVEIKILQVRKRFPGSSDQRTFRLCPTGLKKSRLLSVFHLVSLPGSPWSLHTAERQSRVTLWRAGSTHRRNSSGRHVCGAG